MLRTSAVLALLFALLQLPVEAVAPLRLPQRYALILEGDPLARQMLTGGPPDRIALHTSYAEIRRQQLLNNQQSLRFALALRQITVTGSVHTLLNAVFVAAPPNRVGELRALSGVTAVVPMPALHRKLNKALNLVNAAQAWTALGGASNAGAGIKIAILDTGIDQTHPGFEDPTLAMPPGYPLTDNADDAT
jgi:minor extracellular serine protease Vpr